MDCSRLEKYIKTFRTACSTILTSHGAPKYGDKHKRCKNNLHKTCKRLQKLHTSFDKVIQTIAISRTTIKYDLHCFQMDDHTFLWLPIVLHAAWFKATTCFIWFGRAGGSERNAGDAKGKPVARHTSPATHPLPHISRHTSPATHPRWSVRTESNQSIDRFDTIDRFETVASIQGGLCPPDPPAVGRTVKIV